MILVAALLGVLSAQDVSFTQQAKLDWGGQPHTRLSFAGGLSFDGNTAAVADVHRGEVSIFVRRNNAWTRQATIATLGGTVGGDEWPVSLSADGNTLAFTRRLDIYVYVRSESAWVQQEKFSLPTGVATAIAISADGNVLVAGNSLENVAYVYTRSASRWGLPQRLTSPGVPENDRFGVSVAVSADGGTIAVGAPYRSVDGAAFGAVSVFTRASGVWAIEDTLTIRNPPAWTILGQKVAVSGDGNTAIATLYTDGNPPRTDTVYAFGRTTGAWTRQAELRPAPGQDLSGEIRLNHSGTIAVFGAQYYSVPPAQATGRGFVYRRLGDAWTFQQQLSPLDLQFLDEFVPTAISGDGSTVLGAAIGRRDGNQPQGEAYIFGARGDSCAFSLSAGSTSVAASGGSFSVGVSTGIGCPWSVTNNVPWVRITSSSAGVGNGNVSFTADPNPATAERAAILNIAGQPHTVSQELSCSPQFTTSGANHHNLAAGGFVSIAAPAQCAWTIQSSASWLTINGASSGTGSGIRTYDVAENTTPMRSGTLSVAPGAAFTVNQLSGPATPLTFVPIAPCRIIDTRTVNGGPSIEGGGTRTVKVPASACGIPASAEAYALNLTVVPAGPLGYVTMFPTGQTLPTVSTLNSTDGRVKANAAIVPAGTDGAVSVFASNPTHIVLDINGYFIPTGGLAFFPIAPCRIADTRNATSPLGGPVLAAGATRPFPVRSSNCGIPADAKAYSLNMTAVPREPTLAYLTTWPAGTQMPVASTLNALTGAITANAAIVAAGDSGDINVFASQRADLIIDINGYFAPPATGGLSFYPLPPCRILDTRQLDTVFGGPTLGAEQQKEWSLRQSNCLLAVNGGPQIGAFALNATVVPNTTLGFLTLWRSPDARPTASTLNALDGSVTANSTILPAGNNGAIRAYATQATELILDVSGYFAP